MSQVKLMFIKKISMAMGKGKNQVAQKKFGRDGKIFVKGEHGVPLKSLHRPCGEAGLRQMSAQALQ